MLLPGRCGDLHPLPAGIPRPAPGICLPPVPTPRNKPGPCPGEGTPRAGAVSRPSPEGPRVMLREQAGEGREELPSSSSGEEGATLPCPKGFVPLSFPCQRGKQQVSASVRCHLDVQAVNEVEKGSGICGRLGEEQGGDVHAGVGVCVFPERGRLCPFPLDTLWVTVVTVQVTKLLGSSPPGSPGRSFRVSSLQSQIHGSLHGLPAATEPLSHRSGCHGSKTAGTNPTASAAFQGLMARGHGAAGEVLRAPVTLCSIPEDPSKPRDAAAPGIPLESGCPCPAPAELAAEGKSSGMVLPSIPQKMLRARAGPGCWVEEAKYELSGGWKFLPGEVSAFAHLAAVEVQGPLGARPGRFGGTPTAPRDVLSLLAPPAATGTPYGKLGSSGCAQHPSVAQGSPGCTHLAVESSGEAEAAALWAAPWKMLRARSVAGKLLGQSGSPLSSRLCGAGAAGAAATEKRELI